MLGVKWSLCIFVLLVCSAAFCQDADPLAKQQGLKLETIGHGFWKPHRPFGFRIYSTPDGTKADVKYLSFYSIREANQYIAACLRPNVKVIYRKLSKDSDGRIIDERIVAVSNTSGKKDFALIRRIRLDGYFIRSSSLGAAIEVEEQISE